MAGTLLGQARPLRASLHPCHPPKTATSVSRGCCFAARSCSLPSVWLLVNTCCSCAAPACEGLVKPDILTPSQMGGRCRGVRSAAAGCPWPPPSSSLFLLPAQQGCSQQVWRRERQGSVVPAHRGVKSKPSYTPGCGAELWCLAWPRSQRKPRHELLACRLLSPCQARSPPACLVLSCNQPVYCSEKVKLVREKKKKKDGFFFLPLSNESLGTFSLLTSESYPIAFAVRPDLQRTPWGKAKILVKPLKRKSTLRDDFLLLLCPDFTF